MKVFRVKLPRHDGLTGADVSYMCSTKSDKFGDVLQSTTKKFPLPVPMDMRLKFRGLRYHLLTNMGLWLNQWDQYLLPDFSDIAPNQKPANPSEFADCTRLFESVRVISISRDLVSLRTVLSAVIVGADGEVGNLTSCGIDADKYPEFGSMNIVVDDIYHDAWLLVEVKMDLDAGTVNSFLATMVKKNIGNEDAEFTGMDERERMEYMCAQLESAGKIILHPENYLDAEEVEIIAAIPTKDLKEVKPKTIVEKTLAPSKMRTVATPEVDEAFDDLPDLTGGEEDQPIYAGESDGEGDGSFGEDSDF